MCIRDRPYEDYVVECLRRYPDMSSAQLYDWILEQNNGIKLSFKERSFRSYVSHIREEYDISKTIKARQYEAVEMCIRDRFHTTHKPHIYYCYYFSIFL